MPEQVAHSVLCNCWRDGGLPVDLYHIAQRLGIEVILCEGMESVDGLTVGRLLDRERVIYLKDSCNQVARQNFTLAHEIGHLLLSQNYAAAAREQARSAREERDADRFACELVMPREMMRANWEDLSCRHYRTNGCGRSRCSVVECEKVRILADRFGVSLTAMRRRIQELRHYLHGAE